MRTTGEVVVRGLHKFFSVGQVAETKVEVLCRKRIAEVLEKLDGQMIVATRIGTQVEFWSRGGVSKVGQVAFRTAQQATGDYDGMVMEL